MPWHSAAGVPSVFDSGLRALLEPVHKSMRSVRPGQTEGHHRRGPRERRSVPLPLRRQDLLGVGYEVPRAVSVPACAADRRFWHEGATDHYMMKPFTLDKIQERGRLRSQDSVVRYEKHKQLLKVLIDVSAADAVAAAQAHQHRAGQGLRAPRRSQAPLPLPRARRCASGSA